MLWLYEIEDKLDELAKLKAILVQRNEDALCISHIESLERAYNIERIKSLTLKQLTQADSIRRHKYDNFTEGEVKWQPYLNMSK